LIFALLEFDNSVFCDQDTDGLNKALEASILRNEVFIVYPCKFYGILEPVWLCQLNPI
jgi:hypothetical protein